MRNFSSSRYGTQHARPRQCAVVSPCSLVTRRALVPCRAVAPASELPLPSNLAAQPRSSGVKPADATDSPFRELEIAEIAEGIGRTRVRQHVNPLSRQHQVVTNAPEWEQLYSSPGNPVVLDLGCGPGRFLLLLQHRRLKSEQDASVPAPGVIRSTAAATNFLGLEIRKALVERANEWSARLGFNQSVAYMSTNATISLANIMKTYPGQVELVCIQFPDPHFKRRHYKRRIFQPALVRDIATLIPSGGHVFLQSDVLDVSVAMRNMFERYGSDAFELSTSHHTPDAVFFAEPAAEKEAEEKTHLMMPRESPSQPHTEAPTTSAATTAATTTALSHQEHDGNATSSVSDDSFHSDQGSATDGSESGDNGIDDDDDETMVSEWAQHGWLKDNPLSVPTEREHYVMQQGLPVYRVLLVRK